MSDIIVTQEPNQNPIPVTMGWDTSNPDLVVGMAYIDSENQIHIVFNQSGKGQDIMEILNNGASIRQFSMMYIPEEYPSRPLG